MGCVEIEVVVQKNQRILNKDHVAVRVLSLLALVNLSLLSSDESLDFNLLEYLSISVLSACAMASVIAVILLHYSCSKQFEKFGKKDSLSWLIS